jgi:hypothetical protein
VSEPKDFNAARIERSMSERRFTLGPYTFKRRPTIPPEVVTKYSTGGVDGDDQDAVRRFEEALLELVERTALITETGEAISTDEAWQIMRFQGDENDVVSWEDMMDVTEWLIAGVVERPTGQPSDSPDGSPTQATGMTSMPGSSGTEPTLTILTPVGPVTQSTQPS